MDNDLIELKRIVLGDVVRPSSGGFDSETPTEKAMKEFVDGMKFPTKPPIYKHPVVPKPFKTALLTKHK